MISEEKELQAAEYVLGVLNVANRKAFQAELAKSSELQHSVAAWEERLGGLRNSVSPIKPPTRVWTAISERLGFMQARKAPWLTWWRGLAVVATVASLVLAVLLTRQLARPAVLPEPSPELTARVQSIVVRDKAQSPLWLVEVDFKHRSVVIETVAGETPGEDKDYELWLLGGENEAPVSLGLIPMEGRTLKVVPQLAQRESSASGVAVSLEPTGGSPTGLPSGPVVYVAPFRSS